MGSLVRRGSRPGRAAARHGLAEQRSLLAIWTPIHSQAGDGDASDRGETKNLLEAGAEGEMVIPRVQPRMVQGCHDTREPVNAIDVIALARVTGGTRRREIGRTMQAG